MNTFDLYLQNFQSISEGHLSFRAGLNFIIGQSNSGKTATFRAIKACLVNPLGSQRYVKKGTKKSEVKILYSGHDVTWERTAKECNYVIDGEEYLKTGKSSASKILDEDTGFVRDDSGTLMNIEEELQAPFPFGMSGSELFKLFENVFCVSDSAVILKSAKEYEKGVEGEIKQLDFEKQKTEIKIKGLKEFKSYIDLDRLKNYKDTLEAANDRLLLLNDGRDLIDAAVALEKANLEVGEREIKDLFSPYLSALDCKKALIITKKFHVLGKSLQELSFQPTNLIKQWKELKALRKEVAVLGNLSTLSAEEIKFTSKLVQYKELSDLLKEFLILKELSKFKLEERTFEGKVGRLKELKSLKGLVFETIPQRIKYLEQNKKREEEKVKSIEAQLKEFKVCPLCHHPLED